MADVPNPNPLRRPKGPPLKWTDAELDRLARVTDEDINAARAAWRRLAPEPFKPLIDAREVR